MQIEETFRDAKNPGFGMSLGHARPTFDKRADVLLLIASLASVRLLRGIAAEAAGLGRGYQANTVVARRVLSLVTLGRFLVSSGKDALLDAGLEECSWKSFGELVAAGLAF